MAKEFQISSELLLLTLDVQKEAAPWLGLLTSPGLLAYSSVSFWIISLCVLNRFCKFIYAHPLQTDENMLDQVENVDLWRAALWDNWFPHLDNHNPMFFSVWMNSREFNLDQTHLFKFGLKLKAAICWRSQERVMLVYIFHTELQSLKCFCNNGFVSVTFQCLCFWCKIINVCIYWWGENKYMCLCHGTTVISTLRYNYESESQSAAARQHWVSPPSALSPGWHTLTTPLICRPVSATL